MITHNGYVIPLIVRSGLVCMDMRPSLDNELYGSNKVPETILTSDLNWDPSCLDYEHDDENWFNTMETLPDFDYDLPFDEYEEYLNSHEFAATFASIEEKFDVQNNYIINAQEVINSSTKGPKIVDSITDFETIQPKFGLLPINFIQAILDRTTQSYRQTISTVLKKTFKSPYPACNVQCREEPIAIDTVYSDTQQLTMVVK